MRYGTPESMYYLPRLLYYLYYSSLKYQILGESLFMFFSYHVLYRAYFMNNSMVPVLYSTVPAPLLARRIKPHTVQYMQDTAIRVRYGTGFFGTVLVLDQVCERGDSCRNI